MLRPIKIVAFGDVHMCHSSTPAEKIGEEIMKCFPYGKWASSIDIMVLEGDFWDKLMPNNHPDVFTTELYIYYLLNFCKHHDILLLIVDGTPLHDAGQLEKFVHINEHAKIDCDLVFVDDIDIRYISKFDMSVLFVPDRPRSHPEDTFKRVTSIMAEQNIEKIDLAIMHGCFQYQMPKIAPEHKHIEDNYLSIVKGPILIGHIHTHSTYDRIIAPGSFSRLRHGEEEAKGFIELILEPSGRFQAKFMENKDATIYKSIKFTTEDIAVAMSKIDEVLKDLPIGSHVRIVCPKEHTLASDKTFQTLKTQYLGFVWNILIKTDKTVIATEEEVFNEETNYVPLIINKNTIVDLVNNRLTEESIDPILLKESIRLLSTLI